MEPVFHREDPFLAIDTWDGPTTADKTVIYKVEGQDIPIVYRVFQVSEKDNGDIKLVTKEDNNEDVIEACTKAVGTGSK